MITENCGFLNKLLPGDLVLADRGFDIRESVGVMCAEVHIPAFTKGKKQLSVKEVESTRKIANVRIHVERVIGSVRQKYTMLQSTVPIVSIENFIPKQQEEEIMNFRRLQWNSPLKKHHSSYIQI
jgi:hypothetical protein